MYYLDHYVIDWDKVQTLDDMKRLFAATELSFGASNPNLESIKDLLRLEKVPPPVAVMD